ncbi:MAG: Crp/Fnr family transcriptional regulator [Parasporobacterium sp.]|nr:Crp/Fnr family transcriptional regulator [Parasporobacterium sp.]
MRKTVSGGRSRRAEVYIMQRIYDRNRINKSIKDKGIDRLFNSPGEYDFIMFRYSAGEEIITPLRKTEYMHFIISGSIKIYVITEEGQEIPLVERETEAGEGHYYTVGDMELISENTAMIFAEALSDVTTIALRLDDSGERLRNDIVFMNYMLDQTIVKFRESAAKSTLPAPIEDRLLNYMKYYCRDGAIKGLEKTAMQLRCSPRQLQRAANSLAAKGMITRTGKGSYRVV